MDPEQHVRYDPGFRSQCYRYLLWISILGCLLCRYGLVSLSQWATSAQNATHCHIQTLREWFVHWQVKADIQLGCDQMPNPKRSFASIIIIIRLLCIMNIFVCMQDCTPKNDFFRIHFHSSRDPLVTIEAVVTEYACGSWRFLLQLLYHFYNCEWIYIVFLGTVFAGIVIPSFRRIRCPCHSLRTDFNTRQNCSYRRCSRNHGKCRNHAARCFDFYFNNSVVQKYHSFYGQKRRFTKTNVIGKKCHPYQSARFLPAAWQGCMTGLLLSCFVFAQQWQFACGNQQSSSQEQTHQWKVALDLLDSKHGAERWWFALKGFCRFWVFQDWFHENGDFQRYVLMMRLVCKIGHNILRQSQGTIAKACTRHFWVCKKCAWTVGYAGVRVGEAKNPGPPNISDKQDDGNHEYLDIGCFNPTQLYGKEESVIQWGRGIYCASETSSTLVAQRLSRHTFKKAGFNVAFSDPVPARRPSISQLRGKASGTAIIANFPIRPFWEPMSQPIADTQRAVDCVVQIHSNVALYIASVYGISHMNPYVDPINATNSIFNEIAERALTFQGPAVITGDLNCNMTEIHVWKSMERQGWQDAAYLDSVLFGREMQPTCKELTRKSFILINPKMVDAIYQCRTCEDYLFSAHPLLLGQFRLPTLTEVTLRWVLPPTTDDFLFDDAVAEVQAQKQYSKHSEVFHQAIQDHDSNRVAKCFANMVQDTWKASCVNCEGELQTIKAGYLKRDNFKLLRPQFCSVPTTRKARQGDFEPGIGQMNIEQRRHTRQLRRIETLCAQVKAYNCDPQRHKMEKCTELWTSIRESTGFHKGFSTWVGQHLQWFVPCACPNIEYLEGLKDAFHKWHTQNLQKYFLERRRARKLSIALDLAKGGSKTYQEIREAPALPLTYVVQSKVSQVSPMRWTKKGLNQLKLIDDTAFDLQQPIMFQGQQAFVVKQQGNRIFVDRPLKLKTQNYKISQQYAAARNNEMHQITADAWNMHWKRDDPRGHDGLWDDVMPLISHIPWRPEKAFRPFTLDDWNKHKKGLKVKSARGGCGYSVKELLRFPDQIVKALFEIWDACEAGMEWPVNWITARVTMLAKSNQPSNPYDTRPITVLSVLYRQWSRFRSREILKYFQEFMPTEVALATNRVPAEAAAALVALKVEDSINSGQPIAGFGLDLQRCFNTVPRPPLEAALTRMGVPRKYTKAWFQMLRHFRRTLCIGNSQGDPMTSYTGIPEGCGMSVVGMAALTWWEAKVVTFHYPLVDPHGYADNWNLVTAVPRDLLPATRVLEDFVSKLKMTINGKKSWLWGTTPAVRRGLKGFKISGHDIPVVCNFSDLGCDINYSRKTVKPKHKTRVTKAKQSLGKIRHTKVPRSFKVKMIKTASQPIASYGSNLHHTPKSTWKTVRADIAKTLGLTRSGASSGLAVMATNTDPELCNLKNACQFWRRFFRYFPHWQQKALGYLSEQGRCVSGPMACLSRTFNDAKWKVVRGTTLQNFVSGVEVHWIKCSTKHLQYMLQLHWSTRMQELVQHRKDWDIHFSHIPMLHRTLANRTEQHRWILHTYLSGKTGTFDLLSKYIAEIDGSCPFCKQADSKEHRLFHCSAFQEVRSKHQCIVNKFRKKPIATKVLGFPTIQKLVWYKPYSKFAHRFDIDKIIRPEDDQNTKHFFVDGSAYHQEYKELTIASYAVVEASFKQCDFTSQVSFL